MNYVKDTLECTNFENLKPYDLQLLSEESSLKFFLFGIALSLSIIVPVLIAVAYYTLVERKVMAAMQRRKGPNVVGFWGFLQPFADGMKLVLKEIIIPVKAHVFIFLLAPVITLTLSLMNWAIIPVSMKANFSDVNLSLLLLFSMTSLGVYGVILAGWASNSKYAFLGGIRSAAQMISYEVSMGFVFVMVAMLSGSLNLIDIVLKQEEVWFVLPLFPMALIFLVIMLAETNRTPFDLPEAEAELVAGYNVEYSSIAFAMFFLGEYSSMLAISSLFVILFLGGWLAPFEIFGIVPSSIIFALKVAVVAFFFVWIRSTLPRYRYDQLMMLGWKKFLPFTLGFLFISIGIIVFFNSPTQVYEFDINLIHSTVPGAMHGDDYTFQRSFSRLGLEMAERGSYQEPTFFEMLKFWDNSHIFWKTYFKKIK